MSRESRQQLRQSKERRQKLIAVGGAVVLAIVLAIELPSVLSGGSHSAAPPATTGTVATTSTTAATGSATTTTSAGSAAAAAMPVTPTSLPNSDPSPQRTKSQLSSFSQFESKDPFVQQVSAETATPSVPKASAAKGSASVPNKSAGSGGGSSSPVQQASARTLAQLGVATIAVNGKSETVRVGASFPSSNPIFKLVSLTNSGAQIGIANGSYTSGAQTVALTTGKSLTLVDTADGVRYQLRLLSVS